MPNTSTSRKKAGLKAVRSSKRRATRNVSTLRAIEIQERLVGKAISAKSAETMKTLQIGLQKLYDKAAKNNVIHSKTADRRKSRLAGRIAKAS